MTTPLQAEQPKECGMAEFLHSYLGMEHTYDISTHLQGVLLCSTNDIMLFSPVQNSLYLRGNVGGNFFLSCPNSSMLKQRKKMHKYLCLPTCLLKPILKKTKSFMSELTQHVLVLVIWITEWLQQKSYWWSFIWVYIFDALLKRLIWSDHQILNITIY